jgi:hypothetical protein
VAYSGLCSRNVAIVSAVVGANGASVIVTIVARGVHPVNFGSNPDPTNGPALQPRGPRREIVTHLRHDNEAGHVGCKRELDVFHRRK